MRNELCGWKLTAEKDGVIPCWIILVVFEVENVDDGCIAPSVEHDEPSQTISVTRN
jgi:hypothetical protein